MKFLIKYPSRGRPDEFKATLKQFIYNLSGKHEVKIICSFDNDDLSMNNPEIREYIDSLRFNIVYYYRDNKNKVEAINANLDGEDFDVILLIADDIKPFIRDYDDIICQYFEESEYGLDCPIHFENIMWVDRLDIYCIMGKPYYDRFKYLYHPDYKSIFCDNEYTEVAKLLKRHMYIHRTILLHNCIDDDELAKKNSEFNHQDWAVYIKRKEINYEINEH